MLQRTMTETVLTPGERRVLANLAIPQNVEKVTHELRIDPYAYVIEGRGEDRRRRNRSEAETFEMLKAFKDRGWAVKVEGDRDPAQIAASLPKRAREMPDDQANIYATRLAQDHHQWRLQGDLWVITEEGIAALHEPSEDEPPPMTPSQVQAAVRAEWDRIIDVFDPAKHSLADAILQEEFNDWFALIADDCARRWGEQNRPSVPGGGAGWTDVVENRIIDWENQKTAMPALVAPWFMKLTVLAFTDTDTATTAADGSHAPTYTGYAPKSVAAADMNAASGGSAANANAITFAACTAGSSTIVGFANGEASGATGDLRKYGTCASTTVSTTQTPATFGAGQYTTSAD